MSRSNRPTIPAPATADTQQISGTTAPPPMDAVPHVVLTPEEVLTLALTHEEGFLLSLVDGKTTVETLLDVAAMPKRRVLITLARWLAMGVIALAASDAGAAGSTRASG
jgi:hypothetical protein